MVETEYQRGGEVSVGGTLAPPRVERSTATTGGERWER